MKPILLTSLMILILATTAFAYYDMDCTIRTTSCSSGETVLLYLYNQSANYSNSHAQLINYSGTKYPSALCCNSTEMPIGNLSSGTKFLNIKTTNSYDLSSGLVLNMTFDVNSSTSVTDYSPYSNNGTIRNAGNISWTTSGRYGGGYIFPGTRKLLGNSINIPVSNSLNISDGWTISAWVKGNTNEYLALMSKAGTGNVWAIYTWDDGIWDVETSLGFVEGTTSVVTGAWEQWTFVHNGTHVLWYKDGTLSSSALLDNIPPNTNNLTIGYYSGEDIAFNGTMDEVLVWNRALAPSEVIVNYQRSVTDVTNAHAESASLSNYPYSAYISSAALPQPHCELQAVCDSGYVCLVSLHSVTNSHVAGCSDPYGLKVCCANREPHAWTTVPDYSVLFSSPITTDTAHVLLGAYISNNFSAPTIAAGSLTPGLECHIDSSNRVWVRNPTGAATTGTCLINSTEPGYPISNTTFNMTWTFATGGGSGGGGGGGGTPVIDSDSDGYSDMIELASGTDPNDPTSHPLTGDTDGDGYTDDEEMLAGTSPNDRNSYPANPPRDTDGDGATDAEELAKGTDPNDATSRPSTPILPALEGTDLAGGFLKMTGVGVLIFLITYGINWFIAWDEDKKKKKRQGEA